MGSRKYRYICEDTVHDIAGRELGSEGADSRAQARARQKLHRIWAAYLGEPDYQRAASSLSDAFASEDDAAIRRACRVVLESHASTRERLPVAERLYGDIFHYVGMPESILDLACAVNPLMFRWMGLPRTVTYRAMDINARVVELVNHYFTLERLRPLAEHRDVLVRPPREHADLALLLKMYHCLEHRRAGAGWELLCGAPSAWVAVSFPTRNLRGRPSDMAGNYDGQIFERCAEKGWRCERLDVPGEAVVLIGKG
jgi:16S rRNA (guanine(1405)-N(7))-methyltransferase